MHPIVSKNNFQHEFSLNLSIFFMLIATSKKISLAVAIFILIWVPLCMVKLGFLASKTWRNMSAYESKCLTSLSSSSYCCYNTILTKWIQKHTWAAKIISRTRYLMLYNFECRIWCLCSLHYTNMRTIIVLEWYVELKVIFILSFVMVTNIQICYFTSGFCLYH